MLASRHPAHDPCGNPTRLRGLYSSRHAHLGAVCQRPPRRSLVESAKALELVGEGDKEDFQGHLDRMPSMIEKARADPPTSDLPGDDE